VWNLYGPTETTVWSSVWRVEATGPILVGHPIANTQLHVLDERRQTVPIGVVGELHIGGAGVARGYHRRPELTAERFAPDPFSAEPGARMYRTGDLARRRSDGSIECLGRIDHQVKIRGYRIELGEIEQVLRGHGGVTDAVVTAVDPPSGDRRLVAYVVTTVADWDALRAHAARHLPDYMVPAHYVALEALPRTPSGKVDRRALPAPDVSAVPREYVPPRGAVEEQLAAIWAEVLRVERIGRTDNFFELGGHSLLATRIAARIEQDVKVHVPLAAFFRAPTIERLAVLVEEVVRPTEHEDGFEDFTL
jgi:acyl carrier protein